VEKGSPREKKQSYKKMGVCKNRIQGKGRGERSKKQDKKKEEFIYSRERPHRLGQANN